MNVFKIWRGYREFGIGYGLPVCYIDMGPGLGHTPEEVFDKLIKLDVKIGSWIVVRNNPIKEKGMGVLVDGLRTAKVKIEVEEDGKTKDPGWFSKVDRWIVDWIENPQFNYNALRARQDMLVCKQNDKIEEFIKKYGELPMLKAVVTDDLDGIWEKIKDYEVRVYKV